MRALAFDCGIDESGGDEWCGGGHPARIGPETYPREVEAVGHKAGRDAGILVMDLGGVEIAGCVEGVEFRVGKGAERCERGSRGTKGAALACLQEPVRRAPAVLRVRAVVVPMRVVEDSEENEHPGVRSHLACNQQSVVTDAPPVGESMKPPRGHVSFAQVTQGYCDEFALGQSVGGGEVDGRVAWGPTVNEVV
jgi:hypothetical protein